MHSQFALPYGGEHSALSVLEWVLSFLDIRSPATRGNWLRTWFVEDQSLTSGSIERVYGNVHDKAYSFVLDVIDCEIIILPPRKVLDLKMKRFFV